MLRLRQSTLRSRSGIALESMESRRLFSVTTWTDDYVSTLTDNYFGTVQMGSNGDPNGFATGISGMGDTQDTWSFSGWDSNLSDGLDSTWRGVTFALNNKNNGDLSFKVGSASTQTFNTGSSSIAINSVTIRADVTNMFMQMDWRSITVKFYSGTSLVETDGLADIEASTMTSGSVQESGTVLRPSASTVTGVTISAQVRLQAAQGTYPGPTDISGQILIG